VITLDDCAEKLTRVDHQFKDLKRLVDTFRMDNPTPIVRKNKPNRGEIEYRIGEVKAVPFGISIIVGELIHNLRCPLDYLICRLAERAGKTPTSKHEFPIFKDRDSFIEYLPAKLAGIPLHECALIELLQPYKGLDPERHPLLILHSLNNIDKHRLLPLMQTAPFQGKYLYSGPVKLTVVKTGLTEGLKSGTHLLTLGISDGTDPAEVDVNIELSVDITFDKASPWHQMSMFQTLLAIRAYIRDHVFVKPLIEGFTCNPIVLFPVQDYRKHLPPPGPLQRMV